MDKGKLLSDVKDAGDVARSLGKLSKGPVDVTFNARQGELDLLELDELTIKSNTGSINAETEDGKLLLAESEKALATILERRAEIEKDTTRAKLVSLSYRDSRIVQTAVAEALLSVEGMGFEPDAKIVMVMQERKFMLVYLALRDYLSSDKRYFKSLEEIVKVSDRTIDKLYETYVKEFELTADERKNS